MNGKLKDAMETSLSPLPPGDCVVIPFLSLRATEGSAAISFSLKAL
jgi:hypothetical protein